MIIMPRDLLLIKLQDEEKDISDSIIIPEDIKERRKEEKALRPGEGYVVAAGSECKHYKAGDYVIYPGFIGNIVTHKDLDGLHIIVAENDAFIGFRQ